MFCFLFFSFLSVLFKLTLHFTSVFILKGVFALGHSSCFAQLIIFPSEIRDKIHRAEWLSQGSLSKPNCISLIKEGVSMSDYIFFPASVCWTWCFIVSLHLSVLLSLYSLYCLSFRLLPCTSVNLLSPISYISIRLRLKYLRRSSLFETETWNVLLQSSSHRHTHTMLTLELSDRCTFTLPICVCGHRH